MKLYELLLKQKMSKYELAKKAQIPYTTLNDLFNERTDLSKSSAAMVYRLAKALDVPMESLLTEASLTPIRSDFESYKSTIRHRVHEQGELEFLERVITEDWITQYANRQWFAEALYLLAMVDFLCRRNEIPLIREYESLRSMRLSQPIFPASLMVMSIRERRKAYDSSLPEFKRFNIVENEIDRVA